MPGSRVVVGGGGVRGVEGDAGGFAGAVDPGRSRTAVMREQHLLTYRRGGAAGR